MAMNYLGIDIGGSSVKVAALDDGRVIWTGQSQRYDRPDREQLIQAIRCAAEGKAVRADAVGLCVPGLLDTCERIVRLSVNVPGLHGANIDTLVGAALGKGMKRIEPVTDSMATAYDLWSQRRLKGRLLVLALGTGVGAAVLDDGKPLRVDGQSPGHLGQMDVSVEGERVVGSDGGAGSLEGYIGARALMQRYGRDAAEALKGFRGDELPLRALAKAIRIAHAIYRPHHVVLAGGIGIRLGHVLGRLREIIETNLTGIARPGWTLSVGESDFHAAVGAARMASLNRPTTPE